METLDPKINIQKRRRKIGKTTKGKRQKSTAYLKDFCNDDETPRLTTDVLEEKKELVLLEPAPRKALPLLLFQRELGFSGMRNPRQQTLFKRKKDLPLQRIIPTRVQKNIPPRMLEDCFPQLQRDLGYSRHWNGIRWQSQMLLNSLEEDYKPVRVNNSKPRKGWRPYTQRIIPFTKLQTPSDAAILAIDRQGSYSLALTVTDETRLAANEPSMALSFYGLPSPSVLDRAATRKRGEEGHVSPLLQRVTVLSKSTTPRGAIPFNVTWDPVNILVSSSWKVGVALIVNPNSKYVADDWNVYDYALGRTVLFPLPRNGHQSDTVQTLRSSEINMKSFNSQIKRNLLWQVNQLPVRKVASHDENQNVDNQPNHFLCDNFFEQPGHLLFHDEGKRLRLTWITDVSWWQEAACIKRVELNPMINSISTRADIVCEVDEKDTIWKETFNDCQTGCIVDAANIQDSTLGRLKIAYEAFVNIELLLGDLLLAHQGMTKHIPSGDGENQYAQVVDVVSVNDAGRSVNLVIAVSSPLASYGVHVTLDVFTKRFRSHGWMKKATVANQSQLRNVGKSLALNTRMKQRRLGPYAALPDDSWPWVSSLCQEQHSENGYYFEKERDEDPAQWKPFAETARVAREEGRVFQVPENKCKTIPYSSLYPDCELITNRSLRQEVPVAEIQGMKSPLKLVYS